MRARRIWLAVLCGGAAFVVLVLVVASQSWTANHFGYALRGNDGLPTYIYANGRRYHSEQVCAGADWCARDRALFGIPRCYTQADIQRMFRVWPLVPVSSMGTLFGAPHTIWTTPGPRGLTEPFIVADGPDCYVTYSLEGGP